MKARTIDPGSRMEWIDWAKFVAIFLVVLGHLPTPVGRYLFCFHMAFFFLISGFLAKRRPLKEELKRSAKALLLPYVIYNCFLLIYSYFTKELKPNYPLMMLLGNQWELSMACRPLWFLLSLFLIRIVYALVGEKGSVWAALVCIALVYAGRAAEVLKPQNDWFQVWPAVICFPFFALGVQTRRLGLHKFSDGWNKAGWLRYPLLVGAFVLGIWLTRFYAPVNIFRCAPGKIPWLFYLGASLLSWSLFTLIYKTLDVRCNYVRLVSEGTLLIFALHQAIFMRPAVHSLIASGGPWAALLAACLAVLGLSGLAWLARRYCPVLLGK